MERWRRTITTLAILVTGMGCADTGPPPGGPEDKTGPTVVLAEPPNGAVNLAGIKSVRLEFSERISSPVQGSTVYISPRPTKPPKISWGSRSLKIDFIDTLPSNRTYIISLPGVLTDLRGNKPDTAISLAFSTGPILDSGKIAGQVTLGDKGVAGVAVGLYQADRFATTAPIDSLYPDYLTVTGGTGAFQFSNLPNAKFALIAYQKTGRDERFRPGRQKFALPDREIIVGGSVPVDRLVMTLTSQDTTPVRISSASMSPDGVLQLRMSKPVRHSDVEISLSSLLVLTGGEQQSAAALMPADSEIVTSVVAYCGRLPEGVASIKWGLDTSRPALTFDSLKISGAGDTTKPKILAFEPSPEPLLTADTAVHIRFSEPLDSSKLEDTTLVLKSVRDSAKVPARRSMSNPFDLVLRADSLKAGAAYSVSIDESGIRDLAGNPLGDSLRTFGFSVFPTDSLGWIDGTVRVQTSNDSKADIGLSFRRIVDGRLVSLYQARGAFHLALPAGKYLIAGYVDRNGNRRFDAGSIFPLSLSETQLGFVDTVAVRARFETAGVDVEFR